MRGFLSVQCCVAAGLVVLVAACAGSDTPMAPVNSTPDPVSYPAFTVTSPERAAMLQQGTLAPQNVAVTGMVCDPRYPLASLTLNGMMVPVSGTELCQSFNVNVPSLWGLTIISGEARNNRGTVSRLAQSFLRSPTYFPPVVTKDPAGKVPKGIWSELKNAALDDNNRSTMDDFGTLLSLVVNAANWNASLPNPLTATPDANGDGNIDTWTYNCPLTDKTNRQTGYRITRGSLGHGTTTVGVTAVPGVGLRYTVTLTNLNLPVTVFGALDLGCVGEVDASVSGTVRATSVVIVATARIATNGAVTLSNLDITSNGVVVDVDFTALSIINTLVSGITTYLANVLSNSAIGNFLFNLCAPQLSALVTDFIPSSPAGAVSGVELDVKPDTSEFPATDPGIRFGMAVQALPDAVRPGAAPAKGGVKRDGPSPKFPGPGKFGMAVKDDLLNQFFWAAWRKGTFDRASLSSLGCDGTVSGGAVSFATFAMLPPVLMPVGADSVAVGLGDVRLTGTVARSVVGGTGAPIEVTLYASGIATGAMAVTTSGALTVAFAPTPQVAAQVIAISDSSVLEPLRTAVAPFFACVAQKVAQTTLETFPLLELKPPAAKFPGMPPTKWKVEAPNVGREDAYTTLKGNVKAY